ncbi:MAG: alpha-L-fucosidase [Sedimentisphaerales bacterium]|nr:alpha-L-fucosidase [Sedimentisphaerales bacterium]
MLRFSKGVLSCIILFVASSCLSAAKDPTPAGSDALEDWQGSRFGMFIHWGPVALKGTEIGWSRGAQVSVEEYDQLYKQFNPEQFNAEEWVRVAKEAGMKYIVLTSKHHDGFCLWPSQYTDYHIGNSPFKRDVIKELSEACKRQGIKFSTYYSVCDWHHPDYPLDSPGGKGKKTEHNMPRYYEYVKNQTREIIDNYGPLQVMWFDGEWEIPWTCEYGNGLYDYLKQIQPSLIINNRVSKGRHGMAGTTKQSELNAGDYDTPEQRIGGFKRDRPWETCMTICKQWAWKPNDKMKSLKECIQTLIMTVGGDGNLLFNVGPMPDGRIELRQVERLKEMGQWLKKYGDGIYNTRGGPFKPGKWGSATCKGNKIYLYVMNWQLNGQLRLPGIERKILNYRILSGDTCALSQNAERITLEVPQENRDPIATVIELTVGGRALDITPVDVPDPTTIHLYAQPEIIQKWKDQRFGMFIHWGPVSLKGTEIGWSRKGPRRGRARGGTGNIPMEEYDSLYKRFDPVQFDADEWVKIAQDAGMQYMVFTSKHHDGFSMFDSKQTDYDIMSGPYGKDICNDLADACHKAGMGLGWYYSPRDWYHPDFATENHQGYLDFYMGQLKELCSNYGKVDILWFDGLDSPRELWKDIPEKSFFMIRELQPGIVLNNRGGLPGDFDTPEQHVGAFNVERPWETCMTICRQWAWKPNDKMKPLKECIQTLVKTVGGDGNFLFNVGPMPDGRIEPRQVERLKEMGEWLRKNGESIYGTRGGPFRPGSWGASTRKGNTIYLHIMQPEDINLVLPSIDKKIVAYEDLTLGAATVNQTEKNITVNLPLTEFPEIDIIIKLTLDGSAMEIKPVGSRSNSVSFEKKATASNVYQKMKNYAAEKAFDDDPGTRWATDGGVLSGWLEVDLGEKINVNRAMIDEHSWDRVKKFELQYKIDSEWKTAYAGTTIGAEKSIEFKPVLAQYYRLNILEAVDGPTIWEFQLFTDKSPVK